MRKREKDLLSLLPFSHSKSKRMTLLRINQELNRLQMSINRIKHQVDLLQKKDLIKRKINKTIEIVETKHGLPEGSLFEKTNKREIVEPRQMAMLIIYHTTNIGLAETGRVFDHGYCSVIYAKKTMTNFIETNPVIYNRFAEICQELKIDNTFINGLITKNKNYVRTYKVPNY